MGGSASVSEGVCLDASGKKDMGGTGSRKTGFRSEEDNTGRDGIARKSGKTKLGIGMESRKLRHFYAVSGHYGSCQGGHQRPGTEGTGRCSPGVSEI